MSDTNRLAGPHRLVRVLACVAAPFDPREVHELAVADVTIGCVGARLDAVRAKKFVVDGERCSSAWSALLLRHLAEVVWSGEMPGALVSHDAATASVVFPPELTGPLQWISLHKVARRVWPGQPSYDLEALARWRAWAGRRGPFATPLPSGAEREAELAAGLLKELVEDPGLPDAGEAAWLDVAGRRCLQRRAAMPADGRDPLQAALAVSAMPSRPLRDPPTLWDDERDWAGVGFEDLRHFARYSPDKRAARAARSELKRRSGSSAKQSDSRPRSVQQG